MAIELSKEQKQAAFATSLIDHVRMTATLVKSYFERGQDLQGNKHPLALPDLLGGFTKDQKDKLDCFVADFANELPK